MKYYIHVAFNKNVVLQHHVFMELATLLQCSLRDLGNKVEMLVGAEELNKDGTNVLVGIHTFPNRMLRLAPENTIGVNTEQLLAQEMGWDGYIIAFSKRHEVWDYCDANVAFLAAKGAVNTKYLRIGYHPELHRIENIPEKSIDVVMYGTFNEKRTALGTELLKRGYKVEMLHKVFSTWRDSFISRSKIILNAHYFKSQIFEAVRITYLMNNGKAVVTEVNPTTVVDPVYLPGIVGVPYENLVDACEELILDDDKRIALEQDALKTLQSISMTEWMREVILTGA